MREFPPTVEVNSRTESAGTACFDDSDRGVQRGMRELRPTVQENGDVVSEPTNSGVEISYYPVGTNTYVR
jgi:hypothetical protein